MATAARRAAAVQGGLALMRRGARRAVLSAARDVTDRAAGRSAVVIAPHPDDETLGCGATVLRKVWAGAPVTVLVVTDGRGSHQGRDLSPDDLAALRRGEMAEAGRRLGLADGAVRWADLPDGSVGEREEELVEIVSRLLAELRPQEVYATCAGESHPDHAAVGRAARRAVRAAARPVQLLEYPVWLWCSWPLTRAAPLRSLGAAAALVWRRRAHRVRTEGLVAAKMHALAAHRSQLQRPAGLPGDQQWPTLPRAVLADARGPAELFFPVPDAATPGGGQLDDR